MHEMSVVESLVDQVRAHVPDGSEVIEIHLEVGALEHLDADIMQLAWESYILDSELAGAALIIERVPMGVRCGVCGQDYEPEDMACLICPNCGDVRPEVYRGKGIVLQCIEIEDGRPSTATMSEGKA